MAYSGMLYGLNISVFHFYEKLLFQIFRPLKIYKNFTVNSHLDNRFHKYICFKYYTV